MTLRSRGWCEEPKKCALEVNLRSLPEKVALGGSSGQSCKVLLTGEIIRNRNDRF